MKFYILDDDDAIIHNLRNIIEDNDLGEVIGYNQSPKEALKQIPLLKPDILLIDLLMDNIDGIDTINKLNDTSIKKIMISQVDQHSLVAKAYNSGIEFFINKPINIIEVVSVIRTTIEKVAQEKKLKTIESLFNNGLTQQQIKRPKNNASLNYTKYILNQLGILASNGGKDILKVYEAALQLPHQNINVYDIINSISGNPNATKQRIRRSLKKALENIAMLGIEDYLNPLFTKYSSSLFEFKDVKLEMDYLKGKSKTHGSINIDKFINGLIILNLTK